MNQNVHVLNGIEWTNDELQELAEVAHRAGFLVCIRGNSIELKELAEIEPKKRQSEYYKLVIAGIWLLSGLLTIGLTFL